MTGRTPPSSRHDTAADTSAAVDAFMAAQPPAQAARLHLLREAILAVDPSIGEGIKWNAPSFRTHEYFATFNLRARQGLMLILHRGAKARPLPDGEVAIDDPDGLLTWLGKDRAQVVFGDGSDMACRLPALQAIVRQWVRAV